MVAQLTTVSSKEVVTFLQGVNHISKLGDGYTTDLLQLMNIAREFRSLDVHGLVRAPGWNHHGIVRCLMFCIFNMVVQIVNGVIGGANALYVIVLHQATSRELWLLQLLVTLIENLTGSLGAQEFLNTESSLQLQVCPVIQRIAKSIGNGLCPLLKLLPVRGILTCAVLLIDTIGTHGTPLVVIAT